ncbi:hypothetical protein BMIN_1149 [Bifidobacterium minimum]|uniref:Uncharacterized protein n=1 Tax=Bifidobacterium minimum TaxID=1693 RepID=A0A087BT98_9BIFI|nr:hypothetical protein BMIN_1149 [Bifidobacterium minimum]
MCLRMDGGDVETPGESFCKRMHFMYILNVVQGCAGIIHAMDGYGNRRPADARSLRSP